MSKKQLLAIILTLSFFTIGVSFAFMYLYNRLIKVETSYNEVSQLFNNPQDSNHITAVDYTQKDSCGELFKQIINDSVAKAISTISAKTKVIEKTVGTEKAAGTAYIPMGTTFTTTSTDWYTINDTAIYIDLVNDYGKNATVSWEASMSVDHSNGQAFARLWDDTNKIAVNGSELTTINNSAFALVSSKDLPFWRGRNLYKLQIKSLNSFEVSLTGGKIKIQY
jgi:hypothetical protein